MCIEMARGPQAIAWLQGGDARSSAGSAEHGDFELAGCRIVASARNLAVLDD
jgi:hypothetical protein